MKNHLKKTLCLLAALTMMIGCTACGKESAKPDTDDDDAETAVTTVQEDTEPTDTEPTDTQQSETEPTNPNSLPFEEREGCGDPTYLAGDGLSFGERYDESLAYSALYSQSISSYEARINSYFADYTIERVLPDCVGAYGIVADDGKTYFCVDELYTTNTYYTVPDDVVGDIFYFGTIGSTGITYSIDKQTGKLYYNSFDSDGSRSSTYDHTNTPLVLSDNEGVRFTEAYAIGMPHDNENEQVILVSDNDLFFISQGPIGSESKELSWKSIGEKPASIVHDSALPNMSPLYTRDGDAETLYFAYENTQGLSVALPDGYTVDDIVEMDPYNELVIRFNDNTVYHTTIDPNETMELTCHETLTERYQNDQVLFMQYESDMYGEHLYAYMTNLCKYVVDF